MTPEQLEELRELARGAKEDERYASPEFWDGTEAQRQFYQRALELFAPDPAPSQ